MAKDNWYLIIIAFLLLALGISVQRWISFKKDSKDKDSIIAEQNDTIRYRKNQFGRLVSEKLAAQATAREIAKAYPTLEKELKDEFNVKMRDMRAYIQNVVQAQGGGKSTVVNNYYVDSLGKKIEYRDVNFDDGYLKFKSSVFEDLDFGDAEYVYSDTITSVITSKKKWLFGNEKLFASTSLRNPNAKSIATTNILVNDYRDKRFVIYGGVGYDPFNNKVVINVGLGYALIKF